MDKQSRIHVPPAVDGWAGAEMLKSLASQRLFQTDGRADRPTDQQIYQSCMHEGTRSPAQLLYWRIKTCLTPKTLIFFFSTS